MSDKPVSLISPPEGYTDWLTDLKGRIHAAQQCATLAVNRERLLLGTAVTGHSQHGCQNGTFSIIYA